MFSYSRKGSLKRTHLFFKRRLKRTHLVYPSFISETTGRVRNTANVTPRVCWKHSPPNRNDDVCSISQPRRVSVAESKKARRRGGGRKCQSREAAWNAQLARGKNDRPSITRRGQGWGFSAGPKYPAAARHSPGKCAPQNGKGERVFVSGSALSVRIFKNRPCQVRL
jgi:hypothetical protein